MNKKTTFLALFFSFAAISLKAQLTNTSNGFPIIGDAFETINDSLTNVGLPIAAGGANQIYDLSMLQNHTTTSISFTDPATGAGTTNFPTANLLTDFQGAEGYLTTTNNQAQIIGFYGDLFGTGTPTAQPFDNPQSIMKAPSGYLSTWSDTGSFVMYTNGAAFGLDTLRITYTAITNANIDAWGQVITPDGTFDCLRQYMIARTDIKLETQIAPFPVWIDLESTGQLPPEVVDALHDTTFTYQYFADAQHYPYATVDVDVNGLILGSNYSHILQNTGISAVNSNQKITIFPNPAQDFIHLDIENELLTKAQYQIFDNNGKLVIDGTMPNDQNISVKQLPSGTYFIRVIFDNKQTSRSFVKQR